MVSSGGMFTLKKKKKYSESLENPFYIAIQVLDTKRPGQCPLLKVQFCLGMTVLV